MWEFVSRSDGFWSEWIINLVPKGTEICFRFDTINAQAKPYLDALLLLFVGYFFLFCLLS